MPPRCRRSDERLAAGFIPWLYVDFLLRISDGIEWQEANTLWIAPYSRST
jgi:hypothetical protein